MLTVDHGSPKTEKKEKEKKRRKKGKLFCNNGQREGVGVGKEGGLPCQGGSTLHISYQPANSDSRSPRWLGKPSTVQSAPEGRSLLVLISIEAGREEHLSPARDMEQRM
jgi:hypothetical protein